MGLIGYSKTDLLLLAPSSVQSLVREAAGERQLISAAIGLASGAAFLLAERWVVSRCTEAFRSFLLTPILRRCRGHSSVFVWSILLTFALALAPAAFVAAAGFSLGAYFAGLLLMMGLLQSGFEILTFSVRDELESQRVPSAL